MSEKARIVNKYNLTRKLGSGSYGVVMLGTNTETQERVAVKVIRKDKIKGRGMSEMLKREITTMKRINHPNVVKIYEVLATKAEIFIVMELVEGGDLLDRIERKGYLSEPEAMRFFASMVQAVQVCHDHDVCHRDLKPDNMMLTLDKQIKITDFGMAVLDQDTESANLLDTICGTPNYVAPEVLAGQGYDGKKADVWSLGCVLFVMMVGELPFDGQRAQMFRDIQNGRHAPFPKHLSKTACEFIDYVLRPNPQERPGLLDIQHHPFFAASQSAGDSKPRQASNIMDSIGVGLNKLLSAYNPNKGSHGTSADKKHSTSSSSLAQSTPPYMNVFEIVIIGLGVDMASSLDAQSVKSPVLIAGGASSSLLAVRRFATTANPLNVLTQMANAMEDLPDVHKLKIIHATFKVKGEISDDMEVPVKFVTRIIQLLPQQGKAHGVYMVETTKMQGSSTKFDAFYRALVLNADVANLISRK
eukprot:c2501_g1_i1.p1 GENE.c2501_g1_i1~~c2501_g1_i1.p1  ORF type:complete len:484 (+),score=125.76 c2501_g1_i1:35-1453(+)